MPRNARCVLPGVPYHVTQRGTDRQRVFFLNSDREMYLRLLSRHRAGAKVRVLAYALMTNHIHAVVIPERADSLAVLFRRVGARSLCPVRQHAARPQWTFVAGPVLLVSTGWRAPGNGASLCGTESVPGVLGGMCRRLPLVERRGAFGLARGPL